MGAALSFARLKALMTRELSRSRRIVTLPYSLNQISVRTPPGRRLRALFLFAENFMKTKIALMAAAWEAWVPCEKLRRAAFIPAALSRSNSASDSLAGPIVQTILAFRIGVSSSS